MSLKQKEAQSFVKDILRVMSKHGLLTKAAYRDRKQFRSEYREFAKKHGLKTLRDLRNYLVTISGTAGPSHE